MKVVVLSGSRVGSKTRVAMDFTVKEFKENYPDAEVILIDLADYDVAFSDGRDYREYQGDTKFVTETIMAADALIIGTPIFQASIPGTLKNLFDLLPEKAFRDKIVGMVVTAGSEKHFLVIEQQLKPILSYMKAEIVQTYVFIEERSFYRKEIVDDDTVFRIQRLVEDAAMLVKAYNAIREEKESQYGF